MEEVLVSALVAAAGALVLIETVLGTKSPEAVRIQDRDSENSRRYRGERLED